MNSRISYSVRTVLSLVLAIGVLAAAGPAYADDPTCYLYFQMENRNRHITGDVNAECSGECTHPWNPVHSDTWGNWGVDSNFAPRNDTTQFMGWQTGGQSGVPPCGETYDPPEWNSCTRHNVRGNCTYYNDPSGVCTSQFKADVKPYAFGQLAWSHSCPHDFDHDGDIDSGGCGTGTRSFSASGQYMHLYEMDPWGGDDNITTLNYTGTLTAQFTCDGWTCGGGSSPWLTNAASAVGTAEIRLRVTAAEFDDPDGCCIDGVNHCHPDQR